jgi:hypothetical protein
MTTHKTIKINPELFTMTKSKKIKSHDTTSGNNEKTRKRPIFKPNDLKNKLLERIKAHKNKETTLGGSASKTSVIGYDDNNNQSDEFNDSMAYLSSLAKQSKEATQKTAYIQNTQDVLVRGHSKTLKKYDDSPNSGFHVELELPEGLREAPMVFHVPANDPPIQLTPSNIHYKVDDKVPYGCLKGGIKPTFKAWNKTMRHPPTETSKINIPSSSITTTPANAIMRENKMNELKERLRQKQISTNVASDPMMTQSMIYKPTIQQPPNAQDQPLAMIRSNVSSVQTIDTPIMQNVAVQEQVGGAVLSTPFVDTTMPATSFPIGPKRIKKTIKRTYTLGKSKIHKTIGILIKDTHTRKRVLQAQRDIKRKGINDIKQYLRAHGLLKAGSSAPNDIIRKIYESSMLSGEITNQDKDILLQNYLKEKEAE